ncbi:uncharacterized protein BCR38DRAFT_427315 [Pseudomassariella vexata]|uniref:Mitochondrial adapter protein MCP1 transmembrane domain-containing protein n=1 Tax=Pseudomassariella vexata TaxID=1141098 RepID=A0A1Y2E7H8_9PEZI|nr:uncharacterized protein BCR38DRAFT_427315 [Pseudomassariella vexata]ORY67518.1 hypothetical protein BCR38DRAFT_427315 [Pseudomassariella vexata]
MFEHTLSHKASQETFISLMQLDPSPMESPYTEKDLPPLPEDLDSSTERLKSQDTSPNSSSYLLGLSGSGRGPVYYLTRIQRYSSYTFTFFAGLHFTSTSLIPLLYQSVPYSEPFLLMARELYQTPLTEPLLVALPVAAHVASGIALRLTRRSQNLTRYGGATPGMYALHRSKTSSTSSSKAGSRIWPLLSYTAASGYFFVVVLASHVGMNRVLPLLAEGDSSNIGLQFVSHAFARHEVIPWIAYTLLLGVGVGHMVWGWAKWWNVAPPMNWRRTTMDKRLRKRRSRMWWGINGSMALVVGVWAAGGLGVVARAGAAGGWLGSVYDAVYARWGQ